MKTDTWNSEIDRRQALHNLIHTWRYTGQAPRNISQGDLRRFVRRAKSLSLAEIKKELQALRAERRSAGNISLSGLNKLAMDALKIRRAVRPATKHGERSNGVISKHRSAKLHNRKRKKRRKGGPWETKNSVWAVSGGLPSLGKRQ